MENGLTRASAISPEPITHTLGTSWNIFWNLCEAKTKTERQKDDSEEAKEVDTSSRLTKS